VERFYLFWGSDKFIGFQSTTKENLENYWNDSFWPLLRVRIELGEMKFVFFKMYVAPEERMIVKRHMWPSSKIYFSTWFTFPILRTLAVLKNSFLVASAACNSMMATDNQKGLLHALPARADIKSYLPSRSIWSTRLYRISRILPDWHSLLNYYRKTGYTSALLFLGHNYNWISAWTITLNGVKV